MCLVAAELFGVSNNGLGMALWFYYDLHQMDCVVVYMLLLGPDRTLHLYALRGFTTSISCAGRLRRESEMGNLVINDLTQEFKKDDGSVLTALDHVSLKVKDKEFVGILGPSGCGKTTLLRLIAGLATARTGSIVLDGEEMNGPSPKIGFVFQEGPALSWRTVIDNIAFGLEMKGMPREERYRISDTFLLVQT